MKIIDMHCDTISKIMGMQRKGEKYGNLRENDGHIDLMKLKKSDYLIQNFAMFVYLPMTENPWETVNEMIDFFDAEMAANSDLITQVKTRADIEELEKTGKLGALLTGEEGAVCQGDIEKLEKLYVRGMRMMTLTWNFANELAYPNLQQPKDKNGIVDMTVPNTKDGLTKKGFEFVERMDELGMLVDVSHLSDAGFYDVCNTVKGPFVASHSNARAVGSHVRNLTDDMIRRLAEKGGVTGINFCTDFLDDFAKEDEKHGSVESMVKNIRHIVNVGGIECVGMGTDFDGIGTNPHVPDAGCMDRLLHALEKEGFTPSEIEKIFYKNVLRVYKEKF